MKNNHHHHQGQIAIIVLLVSAVLLTMGLSASKKTIIDTKVDIDEELLKEAFNTAESGINNYLNNSNTNYSDSDGNSAIVTSESIGNGTSLSSEGPVSANNNQLFWLVNHNDNGSIGSVYYSASSSDLTITTDNGFSGGIKIDYFYKDATGYHVNRFGCNYGGSNVVTGFAATDATCKSITLTGNSLLISVTPIGKESSITITGRSAFPVQGQVLTSVGTVNNNIKTQVKTRYTYQIPSFMLESITARNIVQ